MAWPGNTAGINPLVVWPAAPRSARDWLQSRHGREGALYLTGWSLTHRAAMAPLIYGVPTFQLHDLPMRCTLMMD